MTPFFDGDSHEELAQNLVLMTIRYVIYYSATTVTVNVTDSPVPI